MGYISTDRSAFGMTEKVGHPAWLRSAIFRTGHGRTLPSGKTRPGRVSPSCAENRPLGSREEDWLRRASFPLT